MIIATMVRNRPLTTLLLAATVCVDAVVWTLNITNNGDIIGTLTYSLYLSQLGLLAIWLVLGRTNWWIRLLTMCIFLPVILGPSESIENSATNLVVASIYAGLVSALTFGWRAFRAKREQSASAEKIDNTAWQFSVKHLLIWMTVIAVVSAIASVSDISELPLGAMALMVATLVTVPVVALVMLKGQTHVWPRFAGLLVAVAILGFAFTYWYARSIGMPISLAWQVVVALILQAAITGIWIITVDYDIAQQRKQEERDKPHPGAMHGAEE